MDEILEILSRIERKIDGKSFDSLAPLATRKVDGLGRITLPISVRRELDIDEDTVLTISVQNGKIVLSK